jgi:Fe-S cluster biogenesis protein NfuA
VVSKADALQRINQVGEKLMSQSGSNSSNSSNSNEVYVSLEFTPNPNTLKYSVNRTLLTRGAVNIVRKDDAEKRSPLAAKLFEIPGICGVMIGTHFVTVTKTEEGDWDLVHKSVSSLIEKHLAEGAPVLNEGAAESGHQQGGGSEVEQKIKDLLDREIRPAVAMDGGDIVFDRYENGTVYLHLQGACAGCPSATMTLKMGIETRLREAIPEVQEVVSV